VSVCVECTYICCFSRAYKSGVLVCDNLLHVFKVFVRVLRGVKGVASGLNVGFLCAEGENAVALVFSITSFVLFGVSVCV